MYIHYKLIIHYIYLPGVNIITPLQDAPSNGCINDLGESVFPRKKFTLKPPILDISKRPISDFVFKIEGLNMAVKCYLDFNFFSGLNF